LYYLGWLLCSAPSSPPFLSFFALLSPFSSLLLCITLVGCSALLPHFVGISVGRSFPNLYNITLYNISTMELHDLPSEIFFRIFAYLPPVELAANVSLVCSFWRLFSVDDCIWRYHCMSRWGYWKRAQEQLQNQEVSWLEFYKRNCIRNLSFLVLGAEGGGANDERLCDVQSKLQKGGLVNVESFNVRMKTPTLEYLQQFNAILFFSYFGFDQITLGNLLSEFVESGGGVVFCAYGNCGRGNKLDGKWAEKKYDPLILGNTSRTRDLVLGKIHDADHPILEGVTSFNGGEQSSHGDGPAHPSSTIIAEWSNGRPLAVELRIGTPQRRHGEIIGLNMYPPSSDVAAGGWTSNNSHADRLMANSLRYVARPAL